MHGTARRTGIGALILLSGCFGGRRLTDTDPNPLDGDASDAAPTTFVEAAELCPAEDFAAVCGDDVPQELIVTSPAPLRIDVGSPGTELEFAL